MLVLTSLPAASLGWAPPWPGLDRAVHMVLYGILGYLAARAAARGGRPGSVALLAAGVLFAVIDEVHQVWIPGRTPDVADWAFDVVGFALGAAWRRRSSGNGRNGDVVDSRRETFTKSGGA